MHIFYRQLDFPSEPGVANEILENEPKSCLTVAKFYSLFLRDYEKKRSPVLKEKVQSEAGQFLRSCLIFGQNARLKAKQPSCL